MKDTVAIVGSHPKTRLEFDFTRTDADIWVFNEALSNPKETWCPRADAVFQMHVPTIWRNPRNRNDPKHAEWLATQTETPVYMQEDYADVPGAVRYPLQEVTADLNFNKPYFTSSVAYAIALAAHKGYKRIEIYGVEMETNTEYLYQRDGVTFWIGVALGRGIEVEAHCSIFDAPLYGYEGDFKLDYSVFKDAIAKLDAQLPALQAAYNEKRVQTAELIKNWTATGEGMKEVFDGVQAMIQAGVEYGRLDGAKQENERYLRKADAMIAASGDFIFSRQEFESARQALQNKQVELKQDGDRVALETQTMFQACAGVKNANKRRARINKFVAQLDAYIKSMVTAAMIAGSMAENEKFLKQLDLLIRAAGGSKSERVLLEAAYESRV